MATEFNAVYAEMVLDVGVNLYPGQCLEIRAEIAHYDLVCALVERAYRKGARYVEVAWSSNRLQRIRVDHSDEQYLSFFPDYTTAMAYEQLANDWAFLAIDSTEEQHELEGIAADRYEIVVRQRQKRRRRLMDELMNDKHAWCVIAAPGPKWGAKVLGIPESAAAAQRLQETLKPILRLDQDTPVEMWKAHARALRARADRLTALHLDSVQFRSADTDLVVGLNAESIWLGGPAHTPDRRMFLPNIPTEEVFTTPDYRRTEGHVRLTRPVHIMGERVSGAVLEFRAGKVVAFDAEEGKESLGTLLETDGGSRFLGELALVDCDSPIYKSGLLFYSTLLDENAACHIALGAGYPVALSSGGSFRSDEEKAAGGCNISLAHEDLMIGSPGTDVTGFDGNGREIALIRNGLFVI